MKKRISLIFMCFIFLYLLSFISASVVVHNENLKDMYSPNEIISGNINLTIINEKLDSDLSSNLGQSISLREFLDKNKIEHGISYDCSPNDCFSNYININEAGAEEKTLSIKQGEKKSFGFLLYGNNLEIRDLGFNISSNFEESNYIPLKFQFFGREIWEFDKPSGIYLDLPRYGCYDVTSASPDPYIKSIYCEKISFQKTPSVMVGVDITGQDDKELLMSIYDDLLSFIDECSFKPYESEGCIISLEEGFETGDYYVCVKPKAGGTNYKIYTESHGSTCGWAYKPTLNSESTKDYGIFVKTEKYAAAEELRMNKDVKGLSNLVSNADFYIQSKYNRDCSDGCVLPILAEGVTQDLIVSDIIIDYSIGGEDYIETMIYDIEEVAAKVDFSGELDLELTGFNVFSSGEKYFRLNLDGRMLLNKNITVLDVPVIKEVYPSNPPAGIPVIFSADIESKNNISLYIWDFGDNKTTITKENIVSHIYKAIGGYTLRLNVTDEKGLKGSASFPIIAGSPEFVVNTSLNQKTDKLNRAIQDLNKFPSWYKSNLRELIGIDHYRDELAKIERARDIAADKEDFLELALALHELNIPNFIIFKETYTRPLITDLNDIEPRYIAIITNEKFDKKYLDDYRNSIYYWQSKNINATISGKKIAVINEDSSQDIVMSVYEIDIKSNSEDESYFVIEEAMDDLFFEKNDSSAKEADSATVLVLDGYDRKSLKFYIGDEDTVFFASPELGMLPVSVEITPCNFNRICEEDLGETPDNCISDCKSIKNLLKVLFYPFIVFIIGLIVYTCLQVWYKTRYEKFLFKDRKYLFNLLMFIDNARIRGMSDGDIRRQLGNKKWSGEQVTYAVKKSKGERTGMYEIVPIERLFAWWRIRKARQKINKPRIQGISKW